MQNANNAKRHIILHRATWHILHSRDAAPFASHKEIRWVHLEENIDSMGQRERRSFQCYGIHVRQTPGGWITLRDFRMWAGLNRDP